LELPCARDAGYQNIQEGELKMIKCSAKGCEQEAKLQLRINKICRPLCSLHFCKMKDRRMRKEKKKEAQKNVLV
jgi:hypothetical protein